MHVTIGGLFSVNSVLSRGLLGVDPYTGERSAPVKELPVGIFRHLRRLHKAIKDELEIIAPEHKEFISKWAKDGKFPVKGDENFESFGPAYDEFFGEVVVIPFSPFKTELIGDNVVIPVDLMSFMEEANALIAEELKSEKEPPATADADKGAETPKADAS